MKRRDYEISSQPMRTGKRGSACLALSLAVIGFALVLLCRPVLARAAADPLDNVNEAATQLLQACIDPKTSINENAIATLIDFVMNPKQTKQSALPKNQGCTGAFAEFETRITFPRFIEYSYNPFIPAAVTRPSSLRYSVWSNPRGGHTVLPSIWRQVPKNGPPVVIYGMQREADSPDIHSGVYHEYGLKRLLVFVNYKGHQALISVSKQMGTSSVGKKAYFLGDDSEWTYYYSDEPGTVKKGMGWAKSYIYDYFSVGVYVEPAPGLPMVRSGVFQWLRAGWSGINFVRPNHILDGMRRFALGFNTVLESPRLPASSAIVSAYQSLLRTSAPELLQRYTILQQSLRSLAVRMGKVGKSEPVDQKSFARLSKEQMAEELMVDYIRIALGRRSVLPREPTFTAPQK